VDLIEQAAALAGERISAPVRAAGWAAARALILAACIVAAVLVGVVFLAAAIALLIGTADEAYRWWICLVVAVTFFLAAATIGLVAFRRRPGRQVEKTNEPD